MAAENTLKHRHLEVFRAVMRTGSVTGAARDLGMTQPGASKIIWQAEVLCQFLLFERVNNRLIPTDRAIRLFEETERLFVGMERIELLIERLRSETPPRSAISAVPIIAQEILPHAVPGWIKQANTQLVINMRDAGGVLAMVSSRQADIGFVMSFKKTPGIKSQLIARTRVMCAMSGDHLLINKPYIVPSDLNKLPYISLSRYEGQQIKIDNMFKEYRIEPNEIVESPMIMGASALAHAGVGITFADVFSSKPWVDRGLILKAFLPELYFEYHAIWLDSLHNRSKIHNLVSLISKTARSLINKAENPVVIPKKLMLF